ncbi:beta-propeller fold lactonase family protein [Tianweitania sp. Rool2]|uniref:Beta-propeller fold lactonase family protein n=2 Tax=Oryzicola mucosus TaxID=2767425 RepID=A0A8J6PP15_9HYPH|nr:beta-propeller fold lactonase family protein [Oryzicola mucosus]
MALSPDGRYLYAAFRGLPYRVYVFEIDPAGDDLGFLGTAPLPADICHIGLDATGRYLFGASFSGNSMSVSHIGDDGLPDETRAIPTPLHPHFVALTADNSHLLVPCLGADLIVSYRFDAGLGHIEEAGRLRLAAGSGPRHLARSPMNDAWFVISEKAATVTAFSETLDGAMIAGQTLPILQSISISAPKASDIRAGGNRLYAAERNAGRIGIFDISSCGDLVWQGEIETAPFPRAFSLDASGRFLLVASEKTNQFAIHKIDDKGMLCPAALRGIGTRPTWITALRGINEIT